MRLQRPRKLGRGDSSRLESRTEAYGREVRASAETSQSEAGLNGVWKLLLREENVSDLQVGVLRIYFFSSSQVVAVL